VSVTIGDLDGDGAPEIVVGNQTSASIMLKKNNGSGGFDAVPVTLPVEGAPWSLALADMNMDGRVDVVAAIQNYDKLSVLIQGQDVFGPDQDFPTAGGPSSLVLRDVSGDGHLDVLASCLLGDKVSVLLGDGAGGLATKIDYTTGRGPFSLNVADATGDDVDDIVVANSGDDSFSVLAGDGAGTFAPKVDVLNGGADLGGIVVGDLSGDGEPDVAHSNPTTSSVTVRLGNGSGAFVTNNTFGTTTGPFDIKIAHMNGDTLPDLVVMNGSGFVSRLLGTGGGNFGIAEGSSATQPSGLAVDDLNADGKTDVVVAGIPGVATVRIGNGAGGYVIFYEFPIHSPADGVAIADLDGDGRRDLVFGTQGLNTSYLLGDGKGLFGQPILIPGQTTTLDVTVGDLDEDGRADLALARYDLAQVSVRFGRARTRTSLAVSPIQVALGAALTLTATVTVPPPAQENPPAGLVRFYDGHTSLGTAPVGGGGVATLVLPTSLPWGRSYRAAYSGDEEHLGSHSESVEGTTYIETVGVPGGGGPGGTPSFALEAVRPNPVPAARGAITVRFALPSDEPARIELFDVRGRRVAGREVGAMGAGVHSADLVPDATLRPGVYLVRLTGSPGIRTSRAVIL
jgi:hypothetical protein